ncbi:MAG TPA: ABC transporter permease [Bacteroidales bacterium]|nr:ABC transporter permease [Bacteroidales bacterium]
MFDLDKWKEIGSSLAKNKLRTALTAFGVFWGIFMLVIMIGSGRGLENGVMNGMGQFATNSVFIWGQSTSVPYQGMQRGRVVQLRNADTEALRKIEELELLSPRIDVRGAGNNNVSRDQKSGAFSIFGDYPEWNEIDPVHMLAGRFINYADINEKRKVAVIGQRVREVLFAPDENPLGKYIRINGIYFQVVGVFKPLSVNINFGGDKAQSIHIPFSTTQQAFNYGDRLSWFAMTARPGVDASVLEEKALTLLRQRQKVAPDDARAFGFFNLDKQFKQMNNLFTGISVLVWIVGTGTLLAGVIGISNIMLVVVKERTKEIGIMRAIGATPRKVTAQIISEAVLLTTVAGYTGLVLSVFLLELVSKALPSDGGQQMFLNPGVDFNVAVAALFILITSGALAGLIPARRAVAMKPIDALRYE